MILPPDKATAAALNVIVVGEKFATILSEEWESIVGVEILRPRIRFHKMHPKCRQVGKAKSKSDLDDNKLIGSALVSPESIAMQLCAL